MPTLCQPSSAWLTLHAGRGVYSLRPPVFLTASANTTWFIISITSLINIMTSFRTNFIWTQTCPNLLEIAGAI
jgi:hypothetical protein